MRSARTYVALAAVLGALVTAIGCSRVTTTVPVGEPATVEETQQFVGVWMVPDGEPFHAQHAGGNRLRLANVSWNDEKSKFELGELDCLITKDEGQLYATAQKVLSADASEDDADSIVISNFGRIALSDPDKILLAGPNDEAFAAAVTSNVIGGEVSEDENGKSVSLEPTSNQLSDFVTPLKAAEQFMIEKPLVLRRVKRAVDEQIDEQ